MNTRDEIIFKAWPAMVRIYQLCMARVEKDLKAAGLPPLGWYDVLLELNRAPKEGLRLQEVGQKTLLAKNNVTRLLDRMEAKNLAVRSQCADDRRGVYACITPEGIKMLKKMWPVYKTAITETFGPQLGVRNLKTLVDILYRLKRME